MAGNSNRSRTSPAQSSVVRTKSKKRSAKRTEEEHEEDVVTPQKVLTKPRKEPKHEASESEEEAEESSANEESQDEDEEPQGDKKDAMVTGSDSEAEDEAAEATGVAEDGQVNFADLVGVGEHSEGSDDEGRMETLALSRLPAQVVSEVRNDEPALEKKLADIAIFARSANEKGSGFAFWESLSVTMPLEGRLPDSLALDDLKREQRFAELATAATHIGLDELRKQKKKFRRPTDYFAQMVKTDVQMGKVKAKILHHKEKIESAEKRRNNRDIAKNKKKVRSTQLVKEQEKKRKAKEEIEAFSRLRKQRLRERADGSGQAGDDADEDFPIELLNVEQLDDQNTFQSHADIAAGKKKAWSGSNDKFSKGNKATGNDRNPGNDGPAQSSSGKGKGKLGASGGVQKARGSKKRVGRNRRKAGAK